MIVKINGINREMHINPIKNDEECAYARRNLSTLMVSEDCKENEDAILKIVEVISDYDRSKMRPLGFSDNLEASEEFSIDDAEKDFMSRFNGVMNPQDDELEREVLRDHFAGLAMQGIISTQKSIENVVNKVAKISYKMADAMLKARNEN